MCSIPGSAKQKMILLTAMDHMELRFYPNPARARARVCVCVYVCVCVCV